MNLADVMDDVGAALETITDLRVFPYWADRITPPAAVVMWPDPLTYDVTYRRGGDRMQLPVAVLVGKVDSRSARDDMAQYANGSGAKSVKTAVEAYAATAYDTVRVERVEFGVISVAGVEYLAGTFYLDVLGDGS